MNYFVTLGNVSVPITINEHDNAVVHVIGAERVASQSVKLELSDYWVSMSFIIHVLDPQTFVGNQEALFHHERRQSPDVMFVAELFTFCREIFFGCLLGEYKLKCVKSKEILIMHTFFVQERRKHEYEKNKY